MKRRIVIDSKNCGTGECRVVLQVFSIGLAALNTNLDCWNPVATLYTFAQTTSREITNLIKHQIAPFAFKLRSEE